jgi:carbonic anhydrase/acetyltransferase-like protein (isoleucine patch superfamily)
MNAQLHASSPRPAGHDRLAVVDLLAMVTLAIGVGIAAAIVLGGAVLFFSSGEDHAIATGAMLHSQTVSRPGAAS